MAEDLHPGSCDDLPGKDEAANVSSTIHLNLDSNESSTIHLDDFDYSALEARVATGEFQQTCDDILQRQNAGEYFSPQQLSEMMGLPIWYVDHGIRMAALRLNLQHLEPLSQAVN